MAIIAATAVMAVSPAVFAQADTNAPAAGARPPRGGGRGGAITIEAIDKAVTLTDAEKPKVKLALEDYTKAVTAARDAADQTEQRAKRTAARDALDKKMKEILTADQFTKYQAMPRGGRRGGQGGGGGAPAQ